MKDDRRAKYVRRIMEEIEEFIWKRHVIELMYLDANGEDMYYRVAPICFEEHDGDRYLLASTGGRSGVDLCLRIHYRSERDRSDDDLFFAGESRYRTVQKTGSSMWGRWCNSHIQMTIKLLTNVQPLKRQYKNMQRKTSHSSQVNTHTWYPSAKYRRSHRVCSWVRLPTTSMSASSRKFFMLKLWRITNG